MTGTDARGAALVFAATCDLSAIVRGRAVPSRGEKALVEHGVGWVPADLSLTCFGTLAADSPFGSAGDLRLLPDVASRVELPATPERPGMTVYLADQVGVEGTAWDCCPRLQLRRAIHDLQTRFGLGATVAFEHEFVVSGLPWTHPLSLERLRAAEPFGTTLVGILGRAGLAPETWLPEYGEGQFELTVSPAPALEAADRAILVREVVRDAALGSGLRATFAPMPVAEGTGNGVHVHLSLQDSAGNHALFDPARRADLSELGQRFSAGILKHFGAVVAVTAPSASSYLRLQPGHWSVGGAALVERDREGILRVCPGDDHSADRAAAINLEYRAADATANPWLVLTMLLRAGMAGLANDYRPAEVIPAGTFASRTSEFPVLPADQAAATRALERDAVARTWLSGDLVSAFLAVKRSESESVGSLDDDGICRRYADVY